MGLGHTLEGLEEREEGEANRVSDPAGGDSLAAQCNHSAELWELVLHRAHVVDAQ
jgi:hypothetical protein